MPNEVDRSLLDRLQALRGSSAPPEESQPKINVDLIERKKTPTREDALAARLKSLRSQDESPSSVKASSSPPTQRRSPPQDKTSSIAEKFPTGNRVPGDEAEDDVDAAFQTDDKTLEELLGDVGFEDSFAAEEGGKDNGDDDEKVKALLEELSQSIPADEDTSAAKSSSHEKGADGNDSDDSDGEAMTNEAKDIIARFRDEIEIEAKSSPKSPSEPDLANSDDEGDDDNDAPPPDLSLPSVPSTDTANPTPSSISDITARLSALRTSPTLSLPSVPLSKPAKEPNRLTSRTKYKDDDVNSWCTVCLEDATLLCLGCADPDEEGKEDGDPYCARCWREMHVGPAAAFDDRTHKAVQFGKRAKKDKEKRVALAA